MAADACDVILMSYYTIHGSDQNRTDEMRQPVRIGYRDPENEQFDGQSLSQDRTIVSGTKQLADGE